VTLEELAVDALATARITRLVTQDTITEPLRKRAVGFILDRSSPGWHPTWTQLLHGLPARGGAPSQRPMDVDNVLDEFEELVGRDSPKLATLLSCPWCVGVYVAFGVLAARRVAPRAWHQLAQGLALAQLAGVIDTH